MTRAALVRLALLTALLVAPPPARASEWGGIDPGVTTQDQVRARYGEPSKTTAAKVEGYDTLRWEYEGDRAPEGIVRMTVDLGILAPGGYKANVVRLLTLEPKPWIFGRKTVIEGWGVPDGVSESKNGSPVRLLWKDGLLVTLDPEGTMAVMMVFSPPQPDIPAPAPGAAPKR